MLASWDRNEVAERFALVRPEERHASIKKAGESEIPGLPSCEDRLLEIRGKEREADQLLPIVCVGSSVEDGKA